VADLVQAMAMIGRLRQELDGLHGSPFLCGLQRANELDQLPVTRLQQLRAQLHHDLSSLDKVTRRYLYDDASAPRGVVSRIMFSLCLCH